MKRNIILFSLLALGLSSCELDNILPGLTEYIGESNIDLSLSEISNDEETNSSIDNSENVETSNLDNESIKESSEVETPIEFSKDLYRNLLSISSLNVSLNINIVDEKGISTDYKVAFEDSKIYLNIDEETYYSIEGDECYYYHFNASNNNWVKEKVDLDRYYYQINQFDFTKIIPFEALTLAYDGKKGELLQNCAEANGDFGIVSNFEAFIKSGNVYAINFIMNNISYEINIDKGIKIELPEAEENEIEPIDNKAILWESLENYYKNNGVLMTIESSNNNSYQKYYYNKNFLYKDSGEGYNTYFVLENNNNWVEYRNEGTGTYKKYDSSYENYNEALLTYDFTSLFANVKFEYIENDNSIVSVEPFTAMNKEFESCKFIFDSSNRFIQAQFKLVYDNETSDFLFTVKYNFPMVSLPSEYEDKTSGGNIEINHGISKEEYENFINTNKENYLLHITASNVNTHIYKYDNKFKVLRNGEDEIYYTYEEGIYYYYYFNYDDQKWKKEEVSSEFYDYYLSLTKFSDYFPYDYMVYNQEKNKCSNAISYDIESNEYGTGIVNSINIQYYDSNYLSIEYFLNNTEKDYFNISFSDTTDFELPKINDGTEIIKDPNDILTYSNYKSYLDFSDKNFGFSVSVYDGTNTSTLYSYHSYNDIVSIENGDYYPTYYSKEGNYYCIYTNTYGYWEKERISEEVYTYYKDLADFSSLINFNNLYYDSGLNGYRNKENYNSNKMNGEECVISDFYLFFYYNSSEIRALNFYGTYKDSKIHYSYSLSYEKELTLPKAVNDNIEYDYKVSEDIINNSYFTNSNVQIEIYTPENEYVLLISDEDTLKIAYENETRYVQTNGDVTTFYYYENDELKSYDISGNYNINDYAYGLLDLRELLSQNTFEKNNGILILNKEVTIGDYTFSKIEINIDEKSKRITSYSLYISKKSYFDFKIEYDVGPVEVGM